MKKSQLFISFVKPDFKVIQSKRVFDKAGTCIFAGAFENCDLNKLPTNSRKTLTAAFDYSVVAEPPIPIK